MGLLLASQYRPLRITGNGGTVADMADTEGAGASRKSAGRSSSVATSRRRPKAGERIAFPGISSRTYEHPADRAALVALRAVPGFDMLLKGMFGFFSERRLRMLFLGSAVRVDERQFAGIHAIFVDAARILDIEKPPELYVTQDPRVNAWTLGLDHPFVVISTGTLDLLDDEELRVVLGHELGHALSGHALYSSVLFTLMRLTGVGTFIPLGQLGLRAIIAALKEWYRKAELSCDRAGLLVSQDPGAVTRVHMKMAGGARVDDMNLQAFLQQAEEYEATGDAREGVIRILNLMNATHPFAVLRALEIKRWVESGDYERILAGSYPNRADDPRTSFVDEVKAAAASYKQSFDRSPDPLFKFLRDLGGGTANLGGWVADQVRKMAGSSKTDDDSSGNSGNSSDSGGSDKSR
jgi:Zn-dependent protease with chaperone function